MTIGIKVNSKIDIKGVLKAVQQAGGYGRGSGPSGDPKNALFRCGLEVEREAKLSMKTGGGRRGSPSSPPSPPNVQTGNLRASIATAVTEKGAVIVGPSKQAFYGRFHEFGGEFGGRNFPARPFMRPAFNKVIKNCKLNFRNLPLANTPTGRSLNNKKGRL